MSEYISVYTLNGRAIGLQELEEEVNRIYSEILKQPEAEYLKFEVVFDSLDGKIEDEAVWSISARPGFYFFKVVDDVNRRFMVSYAINEIFSSHTESPLYDFSVVEVEREYEDDLLFIVICVLIAVGNLLKENVLYSFSGMFPGKEEATSIEKIMALKLNSNKNFDEALQDFYKSLEHPYYGVEY